MRPLIAQSAGSARSGKTQRAVAVLAQRIGCVGQGQLRPRCEGEGLGNHVLATVGVCRGDPVSTRRQSCGIGLIQSCVVAPDVLVWPRSTRCRQGDGTRIGLTNSIGKTGNAQTHAAFVLHLAAHFGNTAVGIGDGDGIQPGGQVGSSGAVEAGIVAPGVAQRERATHSAHRGTAVALSAVAVVGREREYSGRHIG